MRLSVHSVQTVSRYIFSHKHTSVDLCVRYFNPGKVYNESNSFLLLRPVYVEKSYVFILLYFE